MTNASGYVSQWADQSGNTNDAVQPVTNQQPLLVSAASLSGKAAVRFNGIEDNVNGSYMHGTNLVNVPNAMTAFTVYDAFGASVENVSWAIGVPYSEGYLRGDMLKAGALDFIFWSDDYVASYVLPTNSYRIRADRLDTNLDTLSVLIIRRPTRLILLFCQWSEHAGSRVLRGRIERVLAWGFNQPLFRRGYC